MNTDEHMKKTARDRRGEESMIDIIISSMTAKLIASVLTYPHEVLRSRMQDVRLIGKNGRKLGLTALIRHIIREVASLSIASVSFLLPYQRFFVTNTLAKNSKVYCRNKIRTFTFVILDGSLIHTPIDFER